MATMVSTRAQGGRRRTVAAWLLLGLPAAYLGLFFFVPMGWVLVTGFKDPEGGIALARLGDLLGDAYVQRLARRTAEQALLSSAVSALLGVPLAHVLVNRSFPGRRFVAALTLVPFVLPPVTVALGFLLTFGTNGWFNQVLDAVFGVKAQVLYSMKAIVLAHAFYNAPVVARMTQAAWERLNPALEESALLLGARRWQAWRDVTLVGIAPGAMSGAALAFIYSFLSFPIVLALGGARYSTLEVEIYTQVRTLLDYETGAMLATAQAIVSLLFAWLFLQASAKAPTAFGPRATRPTRPLFALSLSNVWLWLFLLAAGLLFTGPMVAVAVDSLTGSSGWSLDGYRRIFSNAHSAYIEGGPLASIATSLRVGAATAVIAVALGVMFTLGIVRQGPRRRRALETLGLAPLVVSSVALGYGTLLLFREGALAQVASEWRIVGIHAVLAFPLVVRACRPVFENQDPRLLEAARTLGSSGAGAFFRIQLPLASTALLVAFALAFGRSISEMSATMMLARPGLLTMPVSVYRFLSARDFQSASAMAVVLIAVTSLTFLLIEFVGGWLRREKNGSDFF